LSVGCANYTEIPNISFQSSIEIYQPSALAQKMQKQKPDLQLIECLNQVFESVGPSSNSGILADPLF